MWNPVQYVYENWEVDSYPSIGELKYMFVFAAFFPFLRYILDNLVYERVGRHYIFKKAREVSQVAESAKTPLLKGEVKESTEKVANGGSEHKGGQRVPSVEATDKDALEKTLIKFKESCWKALYYTSALGFSVWVSVGEPWLGDPVFYFKGPGDLVWPDQTMKLKLKALFLFCGGFYCYSIFALLFWETRRKDFVVSMVHHVASVALTAFAYIFRFGRPASLVVAIHDTSDIFLELAKVNRYLNIDIMSSIFFVIFAVSWAVLRLWCYPRYIVYASAYVATSVLKAEDHVHDGPPLYYIFNFILILLLVMHIYWWILIVRVLLKQINMAGKVEKDVRSEGEDEDD